MEAKPHLRACGARPSGGVSRGRWPCGEGPRDDARGCFLGGARSPRPRIRARRKPGHVTLTDGSARGWWPKRGDIRFSAMPSFRACGARPSAKGPSDAKKALRRKPGDDGKGGFLGGTHSVRPRSMAFRMPGHLIATPSVGERPGGLPGTCLGQARAILAGVRSPPLEGGLSDGEMALRGKPGDGAKGGSVGATFSFFSWTTPTLCTLS